MVGIAGNMASFPIEQGHEDAAGKAPEPPPCAGMPGKRAAVQNDEPVDEEILFNIDDGCLWIR